MGFPLVFDPHDERLRVMMAGTMGTTGSTADHPDRVAFACGRGHLAGNHPGL